MHTIHQSFLQPLATYAIHLTPGSRELQESWDKLGKEIIKKLSRYTEREPGKTTWNCEAKHSQWGKSGKDDSNEKMTEEQIENHTAKSASQSGQRNAGGHKSNTEMQGKLKPGLRRET